MICMYLASFLALDIRSPPSTEARKWIAVALASVEFWNRPRVDAILDGLGEPGFGLVKKAL